VIATSLCLAIRGTIQFRFTVYGFTITAAAVAVSHANGDILGGFANSIATLVSVAICRTILGGFRVTTFAVAAFVHDTILGASRRVFDCTASAVPTALTGAIFWTGCCILLCAAIPVTAAAVRTILRTGSYRFARTTRPITTTSIGAIRRT